MNFLPEKYVFPKFMGILGAILGDLIFEGKKRG